eukprot:gene4118-7404_t
MGNKQVLALDHILADPSDQSNIKKLFKKYDKNKNGVIDRDEFETFLKEVTDLVQDQFDKNPDIINIDPTTISKEKLEAIMKRKEIAESLSTFESYDTNKDNQISFEEFVAHIQKLAKEQAKLNQ